MPAVRGGLELALRVVALLGLLTVTLRLPVAAYGRHLLGRLLAVAAYGRHLLGRLLAVAAHGRHLLGRLLPEVTLRVSALLGVSTLLGLVGLLILGRIGRAHDVLPCW